jgi:hypothetical protein
MEGKGGVYFLKNTATEWLSWLIILGINIIYREKLSGSTKKFL